MLAKEKAHLSGGPIPEMMSLQDSLEFRPSTLSLQTFCLARRFALSAPMAEMLAPLIYGSLRT